MPTLTNIVIANVEDTDNTKQVLTLYTRQRVLLTGISLAITSIAVSHLAATFTRKAWPAKYLDNISIT